MLWVVLMGALCYACGSGAEEKKTTETATTPTTTETKDTAANKNSKNPDYLKGMELVAKSDCMTCHKIDDKLIGPAYREVANKYEATEANIKMLSQKIIKGVEAEKGIWGTVPMTAHADLSEADAAAMVKYILLLKNK